MDFKQALDSKIADYNLLNHPFYQAWSAGELPLEALRSYAREYGAFISTVPQGWEALDEAEFAAEEIEHIDLWADFATGLDTTVSEAQIPQVKKLLETANVLFSERATALGALYAFEVTATGNSTIEIRGSESVLSTPESQ